MNRGEVWLADLGPPRAGTQAGRRPVLIFQHDPFIRLWNTVIVIPFTTNRRRATEPTCVLVPRADGGLASDSVALCHQIQAVDQTRLLHQLGILSSAMMSQIEVCVLHTLGF